MIYERLSYISWHKEEISLYGRSKKKKKAVKGGILIFVTTREQNIHVQNLLHKKVNAGKMSEHFSHLARKNAVPSFNVSKWEPSSFSFAFPFSPTIICNLSNHHIVTD